MATPFDDWSLDRIDEEIDEEIARQSTRFLQGKVGQDARQTTTNTWNPIDINRAFVEGNHWQGSDGWVGPMPLIGTDTGFDLTMQALERGFTSLNAIGEVVQRHAAGLIGREPHWTFAPRRPIKEGKEPNAGEQAQIDEAEAMLTEWWDKRRIHAHLQEAASRAPWAERSAVRLYIPQGLLVDGRVGRRRAKLAVASTLEEALDMIHVATPQYDEAVIVTDEETQMQCGLVRYSIEDEETDKEIKVAELTYLDGDITILRQIREDTETEQVSKLRLGKRLTMFEMRRKLLITQQVQQLQRALNLAVSMLPRNVVTGGFLERVLLNAQMPGKWLEDENGEPTKFVAESYVTGPGSTNFIQGIAITDEESGKSSLTTPQIEWRQPVDPKAAITAAAEHYQQILRACDQLHVLTVADGRIGWQSREQARADFESSLRMTQADLEGCGRWVLETALALAEHITNKVGTYTRPLRAVFSCRTDTGPVDAPERSQNDASYKAGTMALSTTMQRNNIMDPEAEQQAIAAQPGGDLGILKERAAVFAALAAVADAYGAAIIAGFTPAQARQLAGSLDQQTQDGQDPNAQDVPPNDQPPGGGGNGRKPPPAGGGPPRGKGQGALRLQRDRLPRETVPQ